IAAACLAMARQLQADPGQSGTYHFAGQPRTSWADFAREIFARADVACAVEDIPTSAYPTPAARPLNSRLDCTALDTVFGIPQPDWRLGLNDILKDLGELA
ncbi:sugar nucleotide-binding protein, partial [Leisingera sp. JC1]|uniref:sugar nucleotide-binding protein n=1 Tax=Leisingera sp. JC1 TaxID=1855282 RepID=UPI000AE6C44D